MSTDFNFFVTDENVWSQVISKKTSTCERPALFIDRDGVIVEEVNYLHRPEDVSLIPGAIEMIQRANILNIPVVIVTNQAGVGRRYYSWKHFAEVQNKIQKIYSLKLIFLAKKIRKNQYKTMPTGPEK